MRVELSWLGKIFNLFQSNYALVYTAIGDDDYMKISGKLSSKRIHYKTKIPGLYAGRNRRDLAFDTSLSEYKIYVKKEFEHKARAAIFDK